MVFLYEPSRRAVGKWETRSVFQGGFTAIFSTVADCGKLGRGSVGERRVRAVMIVIAPPQVQLPASVGQGEEHFHVQVLVPQLAVERFDITSSPPVCPGE